MQGAKGESQSLHDESGKPRKGRVIDMRAWKSQRRLRSLRQRNWRKESLFWIATVLTGVSCIFAVAACIPFAGQSESVILCWFFAVISAALGSFLFALLHRLANRLLGVNAVCMALSMVAAIVKVVMVSHGA